MKTRQTFNVRKSYYDSRFKNKNKFSDIDYIIDNEMYTGYTTLRATL